MVIYGHKFITKCLQRHGDLFLWQTHTIAAPTVRTPFHTTKANDRFSRNLVRTVCHWLSTQYRTL